MLLSVIICTYNREKYIGDLLKSLAANTLSPDNYEILIVDNNCTDHTADICTQFAREHTTTRIRYLYETTQGLSAARNKGIAEAKGDILLYVDDDALVDNNYLDTYFRFFDEHPDAMAAGGPIIPLYETQEPDWMSPYVKSLLTAYMYYGDKLRTYPMNAFPGGGNAAYRKQVFLQIGPFNPQLGRNGSNLMGAEEKDIFFKMRKMKLPIYYLPKAVLHHIIPPRKLQLDYFDNLTLQIGKSERLRTLSLSSAQYFCRLLQELVKWGGTIILATYYSLRLTPKKARMLIRFRCNVTRGLLQK